MCAVSSVLGGLGKTGVLEKSHTQVLGDMAVWWPKIRTLIARGIGSEQEGGSTRNTRMWSWLAYIKLSKCEFQMGIAPQHHSAVALSNGIVKPEDTPTDFQSTRTSGCSCLDLYRSCWPSKQTASGLLQPTHSSIVLIIVSWFCSLISLWS